MWFKRPAKVEWPPPVELPLGRLGTLSLPSARDPRYLVWGWQLLFFVFGVYAGSFSKSFEVLIVSVAVAGLTDLLFIYRRTGKLVLPQSGIIAGTGIALLVEATKLKFYAIGALFSVLSKYLFKFKDRHVFNPSAYGALLVIMLCPRDAISNVTQWGGLSWFTAIIWLSGIWATTVAGVLPIAMLWMGWFALFAAGRAFYLHGSVIATTGIMTGASFALFSFFMITDPRTTPLTLPRRALFCFCVASIDAYFRLQVNPYAIFWGLVLGTATYRLLEIALDAYALRKTAE